ncbi:hypothetical protein [Streptomyces sp. NPDC047525]|uniref:hypothetical protein n=1 Tax=Streptomyces sp. NPDC047525 TaxID=3155264 RepID=UPI0034066B1E
MTVDRGEDVLRHPDDAPSGADPDASVKLAQDFCAAPNTRHARASDNGAVEATVAIRQVLKVWRSEASGAPFTDTELLNLRVHWIYRGLTRAQQLADTVALHMSRHEPVPPQSDINLRWLLSPCERSSSPNVPSRDGDFLR